MLQVIQALITVVAAFLGVFIAVLWERLGMPITHPILFVGITFVLLAMLIVLAWWLDDKDKNKIH